jgi:hypothetical protein
MKFTLKSAALLLALTSLCGPASAQGVTVLVNGQPVQFDQPPIMQDGRVLVPMRGVFERLGATVVYMPATRQIRATHGRTTVDLTLGSRDAQIDGKPFKLDVSAQTVGGRTVVPLRFVSESLGADVKWDAPNRTVAIQIQDGAPPTAEEPAPSGDLYGQVYTNDQPEYFSTQPPPLLPAYDQPPVPGPSYIWTPGYWAWAPEGYYWVPGAWTQAPYVGSLWTPGYWSFAAGRYGWHAGYWGASVGFYGGVNYGFGYVGSGFYGGNWSAGQYHYNRSCNNVGSLPQSLVYVGRVAASNNTKVSYNGGAGGLTQRPSQAEQAVLRQPRLAPLPVQQDHVRAAHAIPGNSVKVNKGKPAVPVAAAPLAIPGRAQPLPAPKFVPATAKSTAAPAHPSAGSAAPAHARPSPAQPAAPIQHPAAVTPTPKPAPASPPAHAQPSPTPSAAPIQHPSAVTHTPKPAPVAQPAHKSPTPSPTPAVRASKPTPRPSPKPAHEKAEEEKSEHKNE